MFGRFATQGRGAEITETPSHRFGFDIDAFRAAWSGPMPSDEDGRLPSRGAVDTPSDSPYTPPTWHAIPRDCAMPEIEL